jgi:hypothetical protein
MTPLLIIIALVILIALYFLEDTIVEELNSNALFVRIKANKFLILLIDTTQILLLVFIVVEVGYNIIILRKF